jgi:hypothetical protein
MKPNNYLKAPLSNVTTLHLKHDTARIGFPKLIAYQNLKSSASISQVKLILNLHDELCKLYSSSSIIRLIKSKSMRWAGHVWGEEECM